MRAVLLVASVVLGVSLLFVPRAFAETETQLLARLEELKRETRRAGEAFSKAYWELDETEVRLKKTESKLRATRKELKRAKRRLNERADAMYRRDAFDAVGFLIGASDFESFVTRAEHLRRIGQADADVVARVKLLSRRYTNQRTELLSERKERSRKLERLRRRRDQLQGRLRGKEAEFRQVKARLDRVRSGGTIPSGVRAIAGPNGMVFPVVGSYYYANTWGASRSGGRRRHQGTDIMAPRGTPIVAILSGTVRAGTGGLGGRTIWLRADNGWRFYYAHLDAWAVRSGRVRAGQVIGTVGSTGNAVGGAPHLHLEIHPGRGPVNPYPYLRAME